jgi:cyanophycinase
MDVTTPRRPLHLLADSSLLFTDAFGGRTLAQAVRALFEESDLTAAYIGASNGDEPAFYEIFEAAMEGAGLTRRRMITSRYSTMDEVFLGAADVILLAGGDPVAGWEIMQARGMRDTIVKRYLAGAALIGVSAGAIQLGRCMRRREEEGVIDTFGFVPLAIDVHQEADGWAGLRALVDLGKGAWRGLGIPMRAGAVYHPEDLLEPVRGELREFRHTDEGVRESLLLPGAGEATAEP